MRSRSIAGPVILIAVGLLLLFRNLGLIPDFGHLLLTWWPLLLIITGASLLVERALTRRDRGDDRS